MIHMITDDNKLLVNIEPNTVALLQDLAKKLNTNINDVLSQAIGLFKLVQGRRLILEEPEKGKTYEIPTYRNQPPAQQIKSG